MQPLLAREQQHGENQRHEKAGQPARHRADNRNGGGENAAQAVDGIIDDALLNGLPVKAHFLERVADAGEGGGIFNQPQLPLLNVRGQLARKQADRVGKAGDDHPK